MSPALPSLPPLGRALLRSIARWPVESQQRARRNAMVSATEMAARRRETDDVEEFLARRGARRDGQAERRSG